MDDKTLSAIFFGIVTKIIPGTLGSLSAMLFTGSTLGMKQKIASVLFGVIFVWYIAPIAVHKWKITWEGGPEATGFVLGLFAIALVREAFKEINDFNLLGIIRDAFVEWFKRHFLGGR